MANFAKTCCFSAGQFQIQFLGVRPSPSDVCRSVRKTPFWSSPSGKQNHTDPLSPLAHPCEGHQASNIQETPMTKTQMGREGKNIKIRTNAFLECKDETSQHSVVHGPPRCKAHVTPFHPGHQRRCCFRKICRPPPLSTSLPSEIHID